MLFNSTYHLFSVSVLLYSWTSAICW